MNDKNKFQEMLRDILEVAKVQGNHLSIEEVKALFGDMELNEGQYDQIFAYLAANKIKISGYLEKDFASSIAQYAKGLEQEEKELEENESNVESEDSENTEDLENKDTSGGEQQKTSHNSLVKADSVYLSMYLEDLEAVTPLTAAEEEELFEKIIQGDSRAKSRMVEGYLSQVVDIARQYVNKGTLLEDLIQEGNMGLISCMESLASTYTEGKRKEFILESIKNYIEAAIGTEEESDSFENRMINRISFISNAAKELQEDLGRDADIYELAEKTNIPIEEIKDILSMSFDAIKVETHHHDNKPKM